MVEYKEIRVNSREFVLGLLIIFFSLVLGVLVPFVAPVLGIVQLVSGVYAYKHSTDVALRTIAVAVIASGIMMFVIVIFLLLFMVSNTTTTPSIENYPGG
ncbi:MAG: hypothetical protein O8C66_13275 [Candidatus Methanoperedens sp.]|nr:hypothetical protein [Candidatus Methanoperedens sp.]MCZ7371469.1 hypothetical protein [Candidatus Methanoperedens sp.]